jgi:Novel STAND NTPase 1
MVQRKGKKPAKKRAASNAGTRKSGRAKTAASKKAASKKARSNKATTRSTAGPGYQFEDLTAAWLMVKMLRGEAIPGVNALGDKLQMQTKALGWEIDDLLVSGHPANVAEAPRLSLSCKSNVQVSSAGLPAAFVAAAWTQWRKPNQMRRDLDGIALVTRDRHPRFSATWADIKTWCADSDIGSALAKISASAKHRKIFASVRSLAASAGTAAHEKETVVLIRALHVFPLDFQLAPSSTEQDAIAACRSIVASGKMDHAVALWEALVRRAKKARLGGGTITLEELWAELRLKFRLQDHPDFAASTRALTSLSEDYISLIETGLPNGNQFTRAQLTADLTTGIQNNLVTFVYGNSGTGKSSLVKGVLASQFPDHWQVWLGPEEAEVALSELRRGSVGLDHALPKVLANTSNPRNLLVIDSAERLPADGRARVKALLRDLIAGSAGTAWRVVIVGQTEAWADGRMRDLADGSQSTKDVEVQELTTSAVIAALRTAESLRWLISHDDAIAALTNMRALAWVMQAERAFGAEPAGAMSLSAVADRLWSFWTDDKASVQNLLMRLAAREANFERSFPLSQMEIADANALDALPQDCPLRRTQTNRIEFAHDLAADWARFQQLKEVADDTTRWASLASSPLWASALRMLGQYLLRQKNAEKTAWDVAFAAVEKSSSSPLAADILLDALCLDPLAEQFLLERTALLFESRGERLNRLLKRFYHMATVPSVPEHMQGDASLNLYLEAQFRKPILGRWLRVAPFLISHKEEFAELMSLDVAKLCETWLTMTPVNLAEDILMPYRQGLAELALAMARRVQITNITSHFFTSESEKAIYGAALAGALDIPDQIGEFALEVARRRPLNAEVTAAVNAIRDREAKEHAEKMRTDSEYRKHMEERRSAPSFISGTRKLPPWPLGPRGRVDGGFRDACVKSSGLAPLMRVRPEIAAEVLLAAIIEGKPEESYSGSAQLHLDLGLAYDQGGYPTIYWKSPFLHFLAISPTHAMDALLRLVDFCTERWRRGCQVPEDGAIIRLQMPDGAVRAYSGNNQVLNWAQDNSNHTGQLFSALAALERWLCLEIDRGGDVSAVVHDLLQRTGSVAVLGVLLNVGKYRPELFLDALLPMLGSLHLYMWDDYRVKNLAMYFDHFTWARQGEMAFRLAKQWAASPYRRVALRKLARTLVAKHDVVAAYVLQSMQSWPVLTDRKQVLEVRVLKVELDKRHYAPGVDEDGDPHIEYPEDLQRDVGAYQDEVLPEIQNIQWPNECEKLIRTQGVLTDDGARTLASAFDSLSGEKDAEVRLVGRCAIAATLIIKGGAWLKANPSVRQEVEAFIDQMVADIGDSPDALRVSASERGRGELKFAAYVVAYRWLVEPEGGETRERQVLRVLTCWNDAAVTTLMAVAHSNRTALGHRWWRLLEVGLLWSALSLLLPRRYDPPPELIAPWTRWLRWLRTRKLDVPMRSVAHVDPVAIAEREEAFEMLREKREARGRPRRSAGARQYLGLEAHLLKRIFSWLLNGRVAEPEDQQILLSLWDFEVWRLSDQSDDEREPAPDELAYELVQKLAGLALGTPVEACEKFWRPVLSLGPGAHYLVDQFISSWFLGVSEQTDAKDFGWRWQTMLTFVLAQDGWTKGRGSYHAHTIFRQLLGFGFESQLARIPGHQAMVTEARGLYALWAEKYLPLDEENLGALCHFLQSDAGAVLRLEGLPWVSQAALREETRAGRWHRDRTGNAMVEFLDVLVSQEAAAITKTPALRDSLVQLAAHLAAKQTPAALALQERIGRLR